MAANDRTITITVAGDSRGAQKAFRDTGAAAGQLQAKVEGVGETFERAFAKIGLQAAAIGLVVNAMRQGIDAVGDYNTKVSTAETQIQALTKSNEAVAQAQAIANREVIAGRGAYSDTIQAIAGLTPIAKRTGTDVEQLFRTVQLLSTLNSGPEGGVEGAIITISEALAGQWTSAMRRFNLPMEEINRLKNEGVPALEILNRVIGESGVTMDSLTASSQSAANQQHIFRDSVARAAATMGDPAFAAFNEWLVKFNKEASSASGVKFFSDFANVLRVILQGQLLNQVTVEVNEVLFIILKSYDNFLRAISGGKIHLQGIDFQAFYDETNRQQAAVKAAIRSGVTQPTADELSGKASGSPVAPDKLAGYSADLLAAYLSTFNAPQLDALDQFKSLVADKFKDDPAALTQITTLFASAIAEIDEFGQLSDGTFGASEGNIGKYISSAGTATNTTAALTAALGDQAPAALQLLEDYRQIGIAQTNAAVASTTLANAQQHLTDVQNQATADLADYKQAVDDARAAEEAHQQAAQDAAQAVQDTISAAQDAADATARQTQAQLDMLNDQLARLQATQQAHQQAAQARAGLEQAVLAGETDEYLKQLDVIDDQTRAIAEKWEAEIGGQRRAKSAADTTVTREERAQRAKILDFDEKIAAARENHDTAALSRLQKQKADYQKVSDQQLTLDRERAAVANDQFDSKKEQLDKENQGIKQNDDAQAKADRAALDSQQAQIKGVQDRQKAEQQAAQERQRQLQAELTAIQRNAGEQARADKDATTAAQKRYDERQTYWQQEETNAKQAVTNAQGVETAMKNTADQAQRLFDLEVKRFKLYADNGVQPGQSTIPATPATPVPQPLGPQGAGGEPGAPAAAPNSTPPAVLSTPAPQPTVPNLIDGYQYPYPPEGYHTEHDASGHPWYVPDGHSLTDYGKTPTSPSGIGPTAGARNILGNTPASAAGGVSPINVYTTVNINGNASASDAQHIGNVTSAQVRRSLQEVLRGGSRQSVTVPRTA